jgi:tRNA(Ile2) C34 agmatinyltransferase TiaS
MFFIGIDDTDTLESRGTGHLARQIAGALSRDYTILGVTRHQLLVDPRVPYTKNNSCSAILVQAPNGADLATLTERVKALMLDDFYPGSDPGLCVAAEVPSEITAFGQSVQQEVVTRDQARTLASTHNIRLEGLGGSQDGIIGALAAVGLAASGDDGRYVLVERSRELSGLQPVSAVLAAGISAVQTLDGQPVSEGLVQIDKMRPARRGGRAVLVVERATPDQGNGDRWLPLKLD